VARDSLSIDREETFFVGKYLNEFVTEPQYAAVYSLQATHAQATGLLGNENLRLNQAA